MFGRPRCREWTPLATQQLRLRSLIQIVGYNIRPPEWCSTQCSFYLTLHHTTMSAPFYTKITHRMSTTNVVIRIWRHMMHPRGGESQDAVIQTWGVYPSGLRYIGANLASNFNSDCFKCNTLVFQMHGGYFCSYKSLKLDIIPPEYELEQGSVSSDSSGRTNLSKITLESKMILNHKLAKESRSVSPSKCSTRLDREYSRSQSPVERGFQQNFPTLRTSSSLNIRRNDEATDPSNIYEHSPDNLDVRVCSDMNCDTLPKPASREELSASKIDLSETAENYDLRNEADRVPKYRYLALSFLKSEIRPSYDATKLQRLHLLQYSIKKRQEAVQLIKERIYNNSAVSDSWSQCEDHFHDKLKVNSNSHRNLFSRDDDLSKDKSSQSDLRNGRIREDKPIVPHGPRLALKLNDLLSFKRILLSDERDSKLANIRRLKERHAKLSEENQDVGTELMQSYHSLSRRDEAVAETRCACAALRALAASSHATLKSPLSWSIIGVPLPICGDENPRSSAVSDAVAAGFAAQAACLAAAVLNQPLRSDSSKLFGAHAWGSEGPCPRTHPWGSEGPCPRTQSLRSLVATERGHYRPFNRFKVAVDAPAPRSALVQGHRHSRSVGSYRDAHELATLGASTASIMGSESNIYNMKLIHDSAENQLKAHSLESEILKMADETQVIFTLGDDGMVELESKLVRLSTNNDDELTCATCSDDNVKRICTEITDFCAKEIHEGFDVAKYMERRESCVCEIEDVDRCVNCESKRDGDCLMECAKSVTDVIVIPSAEAILDTGQAEDGADI
ncbi:putative p63 [Operophtera brumata]|uniref:Putative p63 n=1 Tax=Operophtera brumata TaxID=104452 RepID=A0A0L7L7F4_OPEBR|nr:putative p63 [Operophtera brumata]